MPDSDKARIRAEALARRAAIASEARTAAAAALAGHAARLDVSTGRIVAGFAAIRDEIDPLPLMQALAARGARLALPVVASRAGPLIFRSFAHGDALEAGAFGIPQPADSAPEVVPDLILVPLAAFDRRGHRIGYGGGYYDRTLAALRRDRAILAAGVAFAAQELPHIPAGPHDAALDLVLTEREMIDCRS